MFERSRRRALLVICLAIGVLAIEGRERPAVVAGASAPQDLASLDRRINSLEQRLYSIESNINQLRQQVMDARRTPSSLPSETRDPEVDRLRIEIEMMQRRVVEIECGLVKLDERTLPERERTQNKANASKKDPCRLQPDSPVRLSSRQ